MPPLLEPNRPQPATADPPRYDEVLLQEGHSQRVHQPQLHRRLAIGAAGPAAQAAQRHEGAGAEQRTADVDCKAMACLEVEGGWVSGALGLNHDFLQSCGIISSALCSPKPDGGRRRVAGVPVRTAQHGAAAATAGSRAMHTYTRGAPHLNRVSSLLQRRLATGAGPRAHQPYEPHVQHLRMLHGACAGEGRAGMGACKGRRRWGHGCRCLRRRGGARS